MRNTGRSIRVRKSPAFNGRSIYLDGVSDYIDFQSTAFKDITGNNPAGASNYVNSQRIAGSFPVEQSQNGSGHWGSFRSFKNNPNNFITGLQVQEPNFRAASWHFWVKFPQSELDEVTTIYNTGKDLTKKIMHECSGTGGNQNGTLANVGYSIGLQGNTSGSVNLVVGWGRQGTAVSKRVFRRGHSMLAPDEWYHFVCVYDGWKEVGDPGISMWVNGKTRANVTLKLKTPPVGGTNNSNNSLMRVRDAEGVSKYYWLQPDDYTSGNGDNGWNSSNGTLVNHNYQIDGFGSGSVALSPIPIVQMGDGITAAAAADRLKQVIEGSSGHNGSIICGVDGTGNITLQQTTPGLAGNLHIQCADTAGRPLSNVFEQNGQLLAVAGQSNALLSASFSNGTDKQVNAQTVTPSYPKGIISGELPYAVPTGVNTYGTWIRDRQTTFMGKNSELTTLHTAMHIADCAFWENTALDHNDALGLYNNGSILSDITSNSSTYNKSQPTTASMILSTHGITGGDSFRLEDTTGKFRWFKFSTVFASAIGVRTKHEYSNENMDGGWIGETERVNAEYRVVFNNDTAVYWPVGSAGGHPVTITIPSVSGSTIITYEGVHANTGNGVITSAGNTSWISNVHAAAAKAGNLAAAISSSKGHGTAKLSCSIASTLEAGDTLVIRQVERVGVDIHPADLPVYIDNNAPAGMSSLTASIVGKPQAFNLSSSFINGGNDYQISVPVVNQNSPYTGGDTFSDYGFTEALYLEQARFITASIMHKHAFQNSLSCSIIYANAKNYQEDDSNFGSTAKPAVRIHQVVAGPIGNTPVLYGNSEFMADKDGANASYEARPVVGLTPKTHHDIKANEYTASYTRRFQHINDVDNSKMNKAWSRTNTRSESFDGGHLKLLGWWKFAGPALDPANPRINVISNTVESSSMLEHPNHAWRESHRYRSIYRPDDRLYMRTNPALNVGGTWTGDTPS